MFLRLSLSPSVYTLNVVYTYFTFAQGVCLSEPRQHHITPDDGVRDISGTLKSN
jgi:hypothetical protein